ncbi:ribosomal protection-like ABC-F family protein [Brassicibacter mesophilus]|uniref:ribosomal protection-like ABC-F family protein n=1 Tax=Brassicibacter mesophilus TaxID=745119 RepID=UPI003D1E5667
MVILEMENIQKSFGENILFHFSKLVINENDRIGLIGLNGSGKTTLLKIISGDTDIDTGIIKKYSEISYFKQFDTFNHTAERKLLKELGVQKKENDNFVSGGEKTRLRLAEVLSKSVHLILLDEPTSNLDLNGIELLKNKLTNIDSFVLITHDTELLNQVCNRIIEIRNNTLYDYQGNFDNYKKQKELELETQKSEYLNYKIEKRRLEEAYVNKKKQATKITKKPKKISNSEYKTRNYVATSRSNDGRQKSMQKSAKAIQSRLEHLEVKEKPIEQEQIKLNFSLTNPPKNKIIIKSDSLSFSYSNMPIFKDTSFMIKNGGKTAIIGKNGSGKTTLLKLIENRFPSIQIVPKAKIGFVYQEFENLNEKKTILDTVLENSIQAESVVRNILANLLFGDSDMNKLVSVLSGGEKIRLSLAKLLVSEVNVLILDEPTNYLDVPSVEVLERVLKCYEGTVIFVSHDRRFINTLATNIIDISEQKIKHFEGNLKDYNSYSSNKKNVVQAEKTLLELKRIQITGKMLSATPDEKEKLDKEYFEIIKQLNMVRDK